MGKSLLEYVFYKMFGVIIRMEKERIMVRRGERERVVGRMRVS